jgi:hemolysin activation/secretion protein
MAFLHVVANQNNTESFDMSNQRHPNSSMARLLRLATLSGLLFLNVFSGIAAAETAVAEANRFDILEYVIEGNTTLPAARIEETVYPFMGEHKTIADVEQAREALEKAYHTSGYLTVFVNIPEQKVQNGEVRLQVTEGKIERLKVSGSRYYSLGAIKAGAVELEEGKVPNFNVVQQELGDLNRNAGRRVTPVLRAGRIPGTPAWK